MIIKVSGFSFAGIACGVKKSRKKDLALIVSDRPATAAALFTTNRVKAAPVLVGMKNILTGKIQAVVVNSGNANACTGRRGMRDAEAMCLKLGSCLGVDPKKILPSSTGVIGQPLPMDNVLRGIESAAGLLSPQSFALAAEAILTTDRFSKTAMEVCRVGGKQVMVAGMAKGAGMIAPHMATMLAYVVTNAAVSTSSLRGILARSADKTFHSVTVDGDMSTNDTILFLANGHAGNRTVQRNSTDERSLEQTVLKVMKKLAVKLVEDAEGGTKVVEILVQRARSVADAKRVAFAVANSNLVKTAFFGEDPNFGRIMAAIGYAGVAVDPDRVAVSLGGVKVVSKGVALGKGQGQAARVMRRRAFQVRIDLGLGKQSASVWTSDLTFDYVRINSAYHT